MSSVVWALPYHQIVYPSSIVIKQQYHGLKLFAEYLYFVREGRFQNDSQPRRIK